MRLRALDKSDLERCYTWINDPEVTENLLLRFPMSLSDEQKWLEGLSSVRPEERVMAIEIPFGDGWRHIGNTSFHKVDFFARSAEIGIMIGEKDCWSQGYGRRAMALMLRYGFNMLNLHRIFLRVYATNPRAIRCYEHTGFKHEGTLRQALYKNGQYIDELVMAVLRPEWQDSNEV